MTKSRFPTLSRFLNRTVLLVAVAIGILTIITAYGAVRAEQTRRVEAQQASAIKAKAEDTAKELATLKAQTKQLQNELTYQSAKANSVCDWVRSLQSKYRYTVPPLCQTR